jgi:hypothetical protein
MTQLNASLVQSLTSSSESMSQQAKILTEQVGFFRLDLLELPAPITNAAMSKTKRKPQSDQTAPPAKAAAKKTDDSEWEDF